MSDTTYTPEQTREARSWLADCAWADATPDDIMAMPESVIWRAVARHCDGGVAGFLALG